MSNLTVFFFGVVAGGSGVVALWVVLPAFVRWLRERRDKL